MQQQLFDPYDTYVHEDVPLNQSDKEELLHEVKKAFEPTKRLERTTLVFALLLLLFMIVTVGPKIYLRNSIYYVSRDVIKLEHEHDILKQENERLKASVEAIRYKNQVEDTLF